MLKNSKEPFLGAASKQEILDNSSKLEVDSKIKRLKEFYLDPYDDGSARWWLAEFCLDYLLKYKTDGTKRKDGYTEDILHEIDLLLLQKSLVKSGKLPRNVTHKIDNGKKINIPEVEQSIERSFCAITVHDIDEDFYESSISEFRNYITNRIETDPEISANDKSRLFAELEIDCRSMEILTFGRKTIDNDGNHVKQKTYGGDRNIYMEAVESSWITASVKPPDRLNSLTSRYGELEEIFSIESDMSHLDETYRLFRSRQTLENMARIYPEIAKYFNMIEAKLDVAVRCFECIILNHPSRLALFPDREVNPETAKIDISRQLKIAVEDCEYLDIDAWMLERMIHGFEKEAKRHPVLQNLVTQIREQFDDAIKYHHDMIKENTPVYNGELTGDKNPDIS